MQALFEESQKKLNQMLTVKEMPMYEYEQEYVHLYGEEFGSASAYTNFIFPDYNEFKKIDHDVVRLEKITVSG